MRNLTHSLILNQILTNDPLFNGDCGCKRYAVPGTNINLLDKTNFILF